jgi:hypothetical protein
MDMIILAVGLDQNRLKVLADLCEQLTQRLMSRIRQHASAIFGHEDQMDVQAKHTVSSGSKCS